MSFIPSFGVYWIALSYLLAVFTNFFISISTPAAITLQVTTLLSSIALARQYAFPVLVLKVKLKHSTELLFKSFLILFLFWILLTIHRPTLDTDANVYHLPLSLLMNQSIWYPGIGRLCTLFGYPNGTSVIASLFTSFAISGLENIPGQIFFITLFSGILVYLCNQGINQSIAFALVLSLTYVPDFFWQSYNMGTDLPTACFIIFGLFAWKEKSWDSAFVFFALSTCFKPLGIFWVSLILFYLLFIRVAYQVRITFTKGYIVLAALLLFAYLFRTWIGTGNPMYPMGTMNLAPWAISSQTQEEILNQIRIFSGVKRTLLGILEFIFHFFLNPHYFLSSWWFSPLFLTTTMGSLFILLQKDKENKFTLHNLYLAASLLFIIGLWFFSSPLFRFLGGVLVFITLEAFIFIYQNFIYKKIRVAVIAVLFLSLVQSALVVFKHLRADIIPHLGQTTITADESLSFHVSNIYTKKHTSEGLEYSQIQGNFCWRYPPPCINNHTDTNGLSVEKIVHQFCVHNPSLPQCFTLKNKM